MQLQAVENRTVQLAKDVSTTFISRHDHKWSQVSSPHLAIEGLFDRRVANQHKIATTEIKVPHGRRMLAFEPYCCLDTGGHYF